MWSFVVVQIMRIKEFNVNGTKIAIVPGRQKPAGTANESENAIKQKELSRGTVKNLGLSLVRANRERGPFCV
jgi:hypothetical protein